MRALAALVLVGALAGAARADNGCPDTEMPTVASCGDDVCSCSTTCTDSSDCGNSGCCSNGYCAPACVCDGQGTLTVDCADPAPDPKSDCSAAGGSGVAAVFVAGSLLLVLRRRRR